MDSNYWQQKLDSLKMPELNLAKYKDNSLRGFEDRIKEAQSNIDNLVSAENQANSKVQESQDAYDTFKGEMRHYSEISDEKENEFGVKTAMDNYNDSKDAIAATQAAINALPSSINANSNRVLTQSQRSAAYQAQYSIWSRRMGLESSTSNAYEKVWEQARTNATRAAAAEYASQQNTLENFNKAWTAALNNWNTAKTNVLQARNEKANIESQYRVWQSRQYRKDLQEYMSLYEDYEKRRAAAVQNELNRFIADMEDRRRRNEAELEAQRIRNRADYELELARINASVQPKSAYTQNQDKILATDYTRAQEGENVWQVTQKVRKAYTGEIVTKQWIERN